MRPVINGRSSTAQVLVRPPVSTDPRARVLPLHELLQRLLGVWMLIVVLLHLTRRERCGRGVPVDVHVGHFVSEYVLLAQCVNRLVQQLVVLRVVLISRQEVLGQPVEEYYVVSVVVVRLL